MRKRSNRAALVLMLGLSAASIGVQGMGPDPGGKSGAGVTSQTTAVDHPAVSGQRPSGAAERPASSSGQKSTAQNETAQEGRDETRAQGAGPKR